MIIQTVARIYAKYTKLKVNSWSMSPIKTQKKVFKKLIKSGSQTIFGKDHNFKKIKTHSDYVKHVPLRDYEDFKEYILQIKSGEKHVLWKGKPIYFALTSGTTSGTKYIPLTRESLREQLNASKEAILLYINETKNTKFLSGKYIFLQGSPILNTAEKIKSGRLSGISAHHVPYYLNKNRLPSYKTNCIEDWEEKIGEIIKETVNENMTLISGIPSWVQTYFEKIRKLKNKKIGDVFINFSLFIYGGVNYEPYRKKFEDLIGRKVDSIELFPASEGFFAFQDRQKHKDLLLLLNSGIFYEFINSEDFLNGKIERISIEEVKIGVNYVLVVSTSAGLWAYNTGDTVIFTSLLPHRVLVTGRVKQFLSAFGEHVIVKEVETAMQKACETTGAIISEFTVSPMMKTTIGPPYHEWLIDFANSSFDLKKFHSVLETEMQIQNKYYQDLIKGKILQPLKIVKVKNNSFNLYMHHVGKLGGQFKIPKISNNRKISDKFYKLDLLD